MSNANWIEDFVEYADICEASPRMMRWVAISTIAGALRRKVYIEEETFKWTPNFYVLLVGPPGVVKKSTSINIGYSMLGKVPHINFGPDTVTWQGLITDMAIKHEVFEIPGDDPLTTTCVTLGLDEFGSFYDPTDRAMTDAMTHLWDTKARPYRKMTKGGGDEVLENPYINLIGCTTPEWLASNLSESAAGGGLASRFVYLYENGEGIKDIAYPSRNAKAKKYSVTQRKAELTARLIDIAAYAGRYQLTEEAFEWGTKQYIAMRDILRKRGFTSIEAWFMCRQQTLWHKLAMVISAATGHFPVIGLPELQEAARQIELVNHDMQRIFGYVGMVPMGRALQELLEIVEREGPIEKRALWRHFFHKLRPTEFEETLNGALLTGFIALEGPLGNPTFVLAGPPRRRHT